MATFVFVHGAWQGGWCWVRVARLLRQQGHEVYTPTLTGLGERAHLLSEKINLDTHIQDVLGVLQSEELDNIVLCGHSYGGMVITGVADGAADRIRSLVYLDALVPADGQNLLDVLPSEIATSLVESAVASSTGDRVPPAPAEAFGVNAEDRAWVDRRCVDHPLKTFQQPIQLKDQWKEVPRRVYIYATGWNPGVGATFFERAEQQEGWDAFSVRCGHDVMVDMPDELTNILISSI